MFSFYSYIFECNFALYYFGFGLISSLYFYILFSVDRKKKVVNKEWLSTSISTPTDVPADSANVRLYLNLYFVDTREFIRNIVRSKIPKNRRLLRGRIYRILSYRISIYFRSILMYNSCGEESGNRTS